MSPSTALAARPEQTPSLKTTESAVAPAPATAAATPSNAELPPTASEVAVVASRYGLSQAELTRRLVADKTLKIAHGRLQYREATLAELGPQPAEVETAPSVVSAAAPSTSEAFALHSKPGSKRVIYLDFDGHYLSGTAWNSSYFGGAAFNAPAWDIEGGATVFTETERARIIEVWQRVSEDYSGFDVDVTTQYPGEAAISRSSSTDEYYGTRALISPMSSYVGSYGGIAYVGVYDTVGDYYKPALVFPERLSNSAKNIAEACSHEVGHNLGLSHDGMTGGSAYYPGHGTGETSWAPIMGSGYYSVVTQWSKGEYPYANNTEDDVAIIQMNGLAYRTDDIGNTSLDARDAGSSGSFIIDGRIERNTDVDVVRFTVASGAFSASIDRIALGPNLDVLAELRNSAGSLVAMSNPADALSASINVSLSAGTYYLSVKGTGKGDLATGYSSYACIGQYTITALGAGNGTQLPPVAKATASPASGVAPLSVQFSSALSADADGQIVAWNWTFGDGTSSTLANPSHVYATAGTRQATLTVTDNTGLTGSATVVVTATATNSKPVASISAAPLTGTAPLTVQFSGTGSTDPDGSIASYTWSFGDGTSGSGSSVSHTFVAGTYTVTLTVADNLGATASTTVSVVVSAPNTGPVAAITAAPTSGTAPLLVQLSGAGSTDPDGSIVSYAWDFGDGTSGSGSSVSHSFAAGTRTVRLTVTDNRGATGTASTVVTAQSAPAAYVRVGGLQLVTVAVKAGTQGRATVRVTTPEGVPVAGASVSGSWSGVVTGGVAGTTDANGNVVLSSKTFRKSGTITFTVVYVSKTGYTYDASKNVLVSASLSAIVKR